MRLLSEVYFKSYKNHLEYFIVCQRLRLNPKSVKDKRKYDLFTDLEKKLKNETVGALLIVYAALARKTAAIHRDRGWLGFFKLNCFRKTIGEKEYHDIFDSNGNLKSKAV